MLRTVRLLHDISARLDRGELDTPGFLLAFTRALCSAVGCSRTGIWVFGDREVDIAAAGMRNVGQRLRCLAQYDAATDELVAMDDFTDLAGSAYFAELARHGHVMASHAVSHPSLGPRQQSYLQAFSVHSLMDVSFAVNGSTVGVFRCEQQGVPMHWSGQHLQLLRAVGPRAALSLLRGQHRPLDTAPGALWEPRDAAYQISRAMPMAG
jgi:hypothetical protein